MQIIFKRGDTQNITFFIGEELNILMEGNSIRHHAHTGVL